MDKKLHDYRKSYDKNVLIETQIPEDPYALFEQWFKEVEDYGGVEEPNAMNLMTIGVDGYPKSRIVLLKSYNTKGFVCFTNYNSEKGIAISHNNKVGLSFFWPNLERQVIIKGIAEKVSEQDSMAYYQSRPRGSQLGAWASDQSSVIASRSTLEERLQQLETKYEGKEIPKPPHWGGYCVAPVSIEFWQGRPNRLHDRILYESIAGAWNRSRLAP